MFVEYTGEREHSGFVAESRPEDGGVSERIALVEVTNDPLRVRNWLQGLMDPVLLESQPATEEELRAWLHLAIDHIAEMVLEKRQDYGSDNINMTGRYGVAVRLLDKVSRLLNLIRSGEANFEPEDDTWRDIAGYALIGLRMKEKGEW